MIVHGKRSIFDYWYEQKVQNSALNLSIRLFITQLVNGLAIHFLSPLLSKYDAIICKKCAIISYRRQLSVDNLHIQRSIHTRFSYICVRQYVCNVCSYIQCHQSIYKYVANNKLHHHKQIAAADVAVYVYSNSIPNSPVNLNDIAKDSISFFEEQFPYF